MLVRAEISAPACRVAKKLNRFQTELGSKFPFLTTTNFKKNTRRRFLLKNFVSLFIK